MHRKTGYTLILLTMLVTVCSYIVVDPVPQDIGYHNFADQGMLLGIPNALNVLSNLPFVLVGLYGLIVISRIKHSPSKIVVSNWFAYWSLFAGVALVGIGSAYYHLSPDNQSLVWDRLPMTVAFMGLYSILIAEFISERLGRLLLLPLLTIGVLSVIYWWSTEHAGAGDLRLYAVVQFFPLVTVPIILLFFKSKFSLANTYWLVLASYVLAKLCEHFDEPIHNILGVVSGHSIKHVAPAVGLLFLIRAYQSRILSER